MLVFIYTYAVFVEKILRVQPNVKKLYLLLRAPDTKTATQRLHNEVTKYTYMFIASFSLASIFLIHKSSRQDLAKHIYFPTHKHYKYVCVPTNKQ